MSPFAIKALQLLLSLSLLIVLHELGHFIPAKLFKTRVEKFYLFFDVDNYTFGTKSDLFLRPVVAYVQQLRTEKKNKRESSPLYLMVTDRFSDAR